MTCETDCFGTKLWHNANGQKHRDGDRPAVVFAGGDKWWYRNGQRHRDGDQPAVVTTDGSKWWYRDGQQHRDGDRPAIVVADGTKQWWFEGFKITEAQSKKLFQWQRRPWTPWGKACVLFKFRFLIPRLYDPTTSRGQKRMEQSWTRAYDNVQN
jgi:hypothetical protein